MMADGEHGATVERWLKDRHSEMAEDLVSLLDVETGLCDATLPSRHVDVVADLHVVLDVEAGLAGALHTPDSGDADGLGPRPPRTRRAPTPIHRRRPYLSGESGTQVRPGLDIPAGSAPTKSRLLSLGGAALAWASIAVVMVAMAVFVVKGFNQGGALAQDAGAQHPPIEAACIFDPCARPAPTGAVTRLRIPSIGVEAPLELLALDAQGRLIPPRSYEHAGWYAKGVVPGETGPAVIAGHVDSFNGPAAFYDLHTLRAGDVVEVERGGEWITFRVTMLERYPKGEFPTEQVYRPTPGAELRLITADSVGREILSYRDNIVVYAVMEY